MTKILCRTFLTFDVNFVETIMKARKLQFVTDDQQESTFWFIYLYTISSTCFGRCFRPSSGALDCIYSF